MRGGVVLALLKAERAARKAEPIDSRVFPFGTMPNPKTFLADLKAAGIAQRGEDGTVLDFHALRVTLGTRLCDANVPLVQAQRLLRPADPKLTATIYTRPTSMDLRAALDRASAEPGDLRPVTPRLTMACHETAPGGPQVDPSGPIGVAPDAAPEAPPRNAPQGLAAACRGWWALQGSNL